MDRTLEEGFNVQTVDREKTILACIYARVSSPNQIYGYSLDEQIRRCKERCDIMKWKVCYIFAENGLSGKNIDRPKFQKMLSKAKGGLFHVLVFWKLDRFCRSLFDVINVERELNSYGVSLHSVTEQIDTTSSVGRFNFRNIASAAELERDLIKERSRMGMKALAMQHKWPNPYPPMGYTKLDDGHLAIHDQEKDLVQQIFQLYIQLRSMPEVSYRLNKQGFTTRRGNRWSNMSVKKVLDNELYLGKYNISGVEAYLGHLKIIDEKTFNKAKEVRNRYQGKQQHASEERKQGTIENVFSEYLSFLDEMEEDPGIM